MERKVFLTGGSRGIGQTIKEELERDYTVIAPTREELDLVDEESVRRFVEEYKNKDFYAVINNAGINPVNFIEELDDDDLEKTLQTNLIAPIKLLRGLVPSLRKNELSHIVNISSIWGLHSKPGRSPYSVSKFGLNGLTTALAVELGEDNILVNSVCPGYVNTDMTKQNVSEEAREKITERIPLRRFAEPKEVAKLVRYLISENTYITGQTIAIDGGYTIT